MKKFDRINEKRRAENSIKQAKQREEEKRYVPHSEELNLTFNPDFIPEKEFDTVNLSGVVDLFPAVECNVGNSITSFFRVEPFHEPFDTIFEKRFAGVHEELAKAKRENREQKRLIIKLISDRKKDRKLIQELRNDHDEWFSKYGEAASFFKNFIKQMEKENKKLNENENVPIDNSEKMSRRFRQFQKT